MSTYRIRQGDTLSAIAARFKTSVSELARTNKIANPNLIFAGKTLRVPGHARNDSFEPGKSGDLTYRFDEAGTYEIGCHEPGHYAAGMKITVNVT